MAFKILRKMSDGDEVLVPANTYIASILGITSVNLKPKFVEPDPETFNISLKNIKKSITRKTKNFSSRSIWSSSWFINWKFCKEKEFLIEDTAQSLGAKINKKW